MGNIIVTIVNTQKTLNVDMEIPLSTPADQLFSYVLEILNISCPDIINKSYPACILHTRTGSVVSGEKSVEKFGLWNGDILMLAGGK